MSKSSSAARQGASYLALAAIGFIATAPAHARTEDPTDPVAANKDEDPDQDRAAQDRDKIVVNGQRANEQVGPKATARVVDTPRSVVVLPASVIENSGSSTLADALRTVPGITFGAAEGGNPIGDRPFIRGFDSQGSTFVDGVRDPAAQSREVFATDQVQIVRGSDSTLGGRGSAGGSINIISKLPVQGQFVRASGSYGTADYKRITADANFNLTPTIGFRIAGVWHDQDVAGRDAIWSRRWGVAPSLTIGLGTGTRLNASYYYLESHELPDAGIPYFYTIGNAPGTGEILSEPLIGRGTTIGGVTGTVDRSTFYGLRARDFRDTATHQGTLRIEHDFGGVTLRNTSRFTHNDQSYIYTQPDDQQGNVYGTNAATPATAGGLVWRRANTRYGYTENFVNQTDLYGTFETGSVKHSFAVGAELSWEKARRGTYVLATGSTVSPRCSTAMIARYNCTSLFTPNPNDPWVNYVSDSSTVQTGITKIPELGETVNQADTISFYGFDSITLMPSLILNLGVRFDRFHSKVSPGVTAPLTRFTLERTDELFNWQAGLVVKPTSQTSIYASYATAATPPNSLVGEGQEANGVPTTVATAGLLDLLKVEKTRSYEVGAKGNFLGGQLALGIAAFQTDTDNARVVGPNGPNDIQFVGKRRIRGVEFTANGNITKWWTVFGGYTYLDPKIVDAGFTSLTVPAITQTVGGVTTTIQPARTALVPSVNNGRQATQTAKHSFTLWTDFKPTSRLTIGGGAFYTSRVFGGYSDNRSAVQNNAGVVTVNPATKVLLRSIPAYWRFDLRAGYRLTDNIDISVNVNNVTDETYFTQAYTAHYATIAPGRSAFATINVKF